MSDQQYLVDIQHLQNCTIISAVNGEEKPAISAGSLSEIHFQLCPAASTCPNLFKSWLLCYCCSQDHFCQLREQQYPKEQTTRIQLLTPYLVQQESEQSYCKLIHLKHTISPLRTKGEQSYEIKEMKKGIF